MILPSGICLCIGAILAAPPAAEVQWIEPNLVHLRSGPIREWSDFPEQADAVRWEHKFTATENTGEWTLLIRQQDVKQQWRVMLNGRDLGELMRDENDMLVALEVPTGAVAGGQNVLRIAAASSAAATSDDVR